MFAGKVVLKNNIDLVFHSVEDHSWESKNQWVDEIEYFFFNVNFWFDLLVEMILQAFQNFLKLNSSMT